MSSDYEKFLKAKHSRLNTSNTVLAEIVKRATGSNLIDKKRIVRGESNEVYDAKLKNKKHVIIRISRSKYPKLQTEAEIIGKVRSIGVPAPEILLVETHDVDSMHITLSIQKKIPGTLLSDIRKELGMTKTRKILVQAGKYLAKINSLVVNNFGSLDRDYEIDSWGKYIRGIMEDESEIISYSKMAGFDLKKVEQAFANMNTFTVSGVTRPYLLHGDFGIDHIMVDGDKLTGIIDFEGCKGGDPVYDLAWINYFAGSEILKDIMLGYKNSGIVPEDYERRLKVYQIRLALALIKYYVSENNKSGIKFTKRRLNKLVTI